MTHLPTEPGPGTGQRTRLGPVLLIILGVLAGMGPLSTDLVLPSFTAIAADLEADPALVQLTHTGFLVGIAIGPLLVGPIADRIGRRPVLLCLLALYTVAAIAMAIAGSVVLLLALRVAQGLGAAAGVVLSRAIAADLTTGVRAVRAVSMISIAVGISALVAPTIGGALQTQFGWRAVFVALAVLGALLFLVVLAVVPETHPAAERSRGVGPLSALHGMSSLLRRGDVRGYVVAIGAGYAAMAAFLVASPFVGQRLLHLNPLTYGILLTSAATGVALASVVNTLLAGRFTAGTLLIAGQVLTVVAASTLLVFAASGALGVAVFFACAFLLFAGTGLTMANTTALTLAVAGRSRGSASALCSAGQYAFGALAPVIVGAAGTSSALPMALAVASFAALGVVAVALARLGARA
ncbi:Bcr/CflA family drug resistance efflux transporter [Pseudoclavibacter endophyticus]|uniref:Multidrug effflux MFS transporter n=1 Tax=Pseudoclavibacter endophyticus TaxID=1778590 RepID=A0A6H9WIM8_9MICO|nr:multidrug effflux MFS transporter [Pseudoclavibacter endophyticus]KAB1648367.1 multidrug effflux MFS transporter [Pseudoclavibacter endophyticus]GGA72061.1 Bcr/CflA family drug resistance efflux transporter [Pseudoclavibacter endophyticus]